MGRRIRQTWRFVGGEKVVEELGCPGGQLKGQVAAETAGRTGRWRWCREAE